MKTIEVDSSGKVRKLVEKQVDRGEPVRFSEVYEHMTDQSKYSGE